MPEVTTDPLSLTGRGPEVTNDPLSITGQR